ncbi:MAG: VOC family protein [Shimia sp.]
MNRFTWASLSAHDPARVAPFYTDLFGWHIEDDTAFEGNTPVASIDRMPDVLRARGLPPFWLSVIGVEDVAATTALASRKGARVEIEGDGFALVRDPLGAGFLVSAEEPDGASAFRHARFTADGAALVPFYRAVFGWTVEDVTPGLLRLKADGDTVAHCHTLPDSQRGREEYWAVLFPVAFLAGCGAAFELPEGRACAASDPDGAMVITVERQGGPRAAKPHVFQGVPSRNE